MFTPKEGSAINDILAAGKERVAEIKAKEHKDNWREYDYDLMLKASEVELGQARGHLRRYGLTERKDLVKYAINTIGWCTLFILSICGTDVAKFLPEEKNE